MMKDVLKDMTNQTFGRLTVIGRTEDYISPHGRHEAQWLCKCECGNLKKVRGTSLRQGLVTSCGCYRRQLLIDRLKKYNTYDLSGEYGIGYTSNGVIFYFDLEDYDKIKDYYWCNKDGDLHFWGRINNQKISLHRFIMTLDKNSDLVVDHINTHHPEDNRKANLRIVTHSENQMNRKLAKNNSSGVTGVTWSKKDKRWIANIKINNKTIRCGYYKNIEDAIKARKEAEEKYFGEYSYDNSQKQWKENFYEKQNLS